ncbi:MAG TPA: SGNH/GDSL hydrolase family protein, partial [Armatimonadota bacterium]|nr:SGNH/GDSL hydrolase family protein [Armatimonadota bacterium]
LFIGNSYTNRNDLPGLVCELAAAGTPGVSMTAERSILNGASLRRHWNAGEAARLIQEQRWDAVVLQEQSTLPLKNPARYHENVRLFAPLIRAQRARTVLYLPWARRAAPESQEPLTAAVTGIAEEIGAEVAPVGPAWEAVRATGAGPELYEADGSHPTAAGSYLAACVFYATLLDRSPEGLPAPRRAGLTEQDVSLLQRVAAAGRK